jgi:hypothetical protein
MRACVHAFAHDDRGAGAVLRDGLGVLARLCLHVPPRHIHYIRPLYT